MSTARRCADLFFSAFFLLHIFITVFVDAQVLLPAGLYPLPLRNLLTWYISFSGDYLVRDTPPFFKGLVFAEIFFQLPLVIVNAFGFYHGTRWAKTTGLVYGVHTATTMIPILADLLSSDVASKTTLMAVYIPYLMIPLALTVHVLTSEPALKPRSKKARKLT
eukprot:c15423_g1_i1 orf=156-644(-)